MTEEELRERSLEMVVRHGSTKFTQALAAVKLAERRNEINELREIVTPPEGGG